MSDSEKKTPRAKDRYIELSGPDEYGRAKTHVALTYLNQFSDGTSTILQELTISRKPIVNIFCHDDYVNVTLDFLSPRDADLAMVWQLLEAYSRPINSVDWLPEELESGIYIDEEGNERMVFFPMLQLTLSPFNREMEFGITGMSPLSFTLQPNGPSGEPCVLQLTFNRELFFVTESDQIKGVDTEQLRQEVAEEMALDMAFQPPAENEE